MEFYDLKIKPRADGDITPILDSVKRFRYSTIAIDLTLDSASNTSVSLIDYEKLYERISSECRDLGIRCLRRATFITKDKFDGRSLKSMLDSFDVVAITPTSQEALINATHRTDIDIISFERSSFSRMKIGRNIDIAIQNGIRFELTYGPAITGDPGDKSFLLEQMFMMLRRCRKQNFIISSGISSSNHLRNPYDVMNLAVMGGLGKPRALESISVNPKSVVAHGYARVHTLLGIFELIPKKPKTESISPEICSRIKRKDNNVDLHPNKIKP
ncbi:Ribonuclease P protein subunit p30 [Thelohanellus kitauei]|uniref:Ribonuclease P protein subunit p30 n=1 Tax=Thelohanellus kitauei TaxID=669202 RepID=A0A0C2NBY3_THEKT|nr:Ribonuclease P protein subunit p30 [Thelohanellus kitauei]